MLHIGEISPGKLSRLLERDLCKVLPAKRGGMSCTTVGGKGQCEIFRRL